jgi:hypothetical protein
MLGLDAGSRSTEEKSFQALVPESQDRHRGILTRNVTGYNRLIARCSGRTATQLGADRDCSLTVHRAAGFIRYVG